MDLIFLYYVFLFFFSSEIQNCASVYPELKRACANEKKIILKLKDPKLEAKNATAEEQVNCIYKIGSVF